MAYVINTSECVGCGACAFECLFGAPVRVQDSICFEIDADVCVGCGQCFDICPNDAIAPDENQRRAVRVEIITESCIGCSLSKRACPADAVDGVIKSPFVIDEARCIKCTACAKKCKKDAIRVTYEPGQRSDS